MKKKLNKFERPTASASAAALASASCKAFFSASISRCSQAASSAEGFMKFLLMTDDVNDLVGKSRTSILP